MRSPPRQCEKAGKRKTRTPERAAARYSPYEERTVASGLEIQRGGEEGGTVPAVVAATLMVYAPDRAPFRYAMARETISYRAFAALRQRPDD